MTVCVHRADPRYWSLDPVFAATCQIDLANALLAKADQDIKTLEQELLQLHEISPEREPGLLRRSASGLWSGAGAITHAAVYVLSPWAWPIFGGSNSTAKPNRSVSVAPVKPSEAVDARRQWILEKMGKTVQKMNSLEVEVADCKDSLKQARA